LATIGFGDMLPGWENMGTAAGNIKFAVTFCYLILGLAVLSMSFNLMIDEMKAKFRSFGQRFGMYLVRTLTHMRASRRHYRRSRKASKSVVGHDCRRRKTRAERVKTKTTTHILTLTTHLFGTHP
jgi:hypothetical protein